MPAFSYECSFQHDGDKGTWWKKIKLIKKFWQSLIKINVPVAVKKTIPICVLVQKNRCRINVVKPSSTSTLWPFKRTRRTKFKEIIFSAWLRLIFSIRRFSLGVKVDEIDDGGE